MKGHSETQMVTERDKKVTENMQVLKILTSVEYFDLVT